MIPRVVIACWIVLGSFFLSLSVVAIPVESQQDQAAMVELETRLFDMKGCIALYHPKAGQQVVINDAATLKSYVWNDVRSERCLAYLKEIDFNKHTFLGIEIN